MKKTHFKNALTTRYAEKLLSFIIEHWLFTIFFLSLCFANVALILRREPEVLSFSCSTHDQGPYGTSAFFEHLVKNRINARRVSVPLYNYLKENSRGETLLILSPRYNPPAWAWEHIISWVAQGNRLITSGITGPRSSLFSENNDLAISLSRTTPEQVDVLLPVHQQSPTTLSPDPQTGISLLKHEKKEPGDTILLSHLQPLAFTEETVPFLSMDNKIISAKRAVGKGEWIIFTQPNPFSNNLLKDHDWYRFAVSLIARDSRFAKGEIIFDEYHNGYRATENLTGLLRFYKFDKGIIFLICISSLYLFFSGIRVSPPPQEAGQRVAKDVLPGLKALSNLIQRHKAYKNLLRRELNLITLQISGKSSGSLTSGELYEQYVRKTGHPPDMEKEEFCAITGLVSGNAPMGGENALRALNLFVHMRKELKL